jgi:hypothetical protein
VSALAGKGLHNFSYVQCLRWQRNRGCAGLLMRNFVKEKLIVLGCYVKVNFSNTFHDCSQQLTFKMVDRKVGTYMKCVTVAC